MKRLLAIALTGFTLGLCSCGHDYSQYPAEQNNVRVTPLKNDVNIQADQGNAAFDVNKLSEIVQHSTEPKVLEEKINDPSTNINNLDLDKDGKVDYLTVTENDQNQMVISDASVDPAVTVAKITITPDQQAQTAGMQIVGEPAYCGSYNTYYNPHISFGELLFLSYLLAPHSYYHPYYGYGRYPAYYTTHRTVVRTVYTPSRSNYVSRGSSSAAPSRSSLSSPSRSQRSFSNRDASRPVGSGGFGNRPTAPSRSFGSGGGGSRRSFGGRRR